MKKRSQPARKPDATSLSDTPSPQAAEAPLESAGEVLITHYAVPPKGPADKQIHPRRPLPPVPKAPRPKAK